ncbi:hypothetical protein [Streptomyces sp. NBC_01197]|uniref:hypothetical protein n=1 Tax=Streptomyces sp. NBC_01197 TaxID=2903768 RepID=UPI002E1047BC|nr:hypothetical protein OG452_07440 [Streptomyces sp. NBC_01197]
MDKQGLVMEQKPDGGAETGSGKRGQLDLSVPQVAGSAFAAVVAAVLASKLGVYGTIIGAGLVSVIATCGGTIFQHFFRRTGEQIREVTVQVKPRALKIPVRQVPGAPEPGEAPPTIAVPWPGQSGADRTGGFPGDGEPDATRPLTPVAGEGFSGEEFTEATTHGTRVRGWKRSSLAALVVFLVAMAGISGFELLSGHGLSGGPGTTVGSVVQGGSGTRHHSPGPAVSTDPQQSQDPRQQDRQQSTGPDPSPGTGSGSGDTGRSKPDPGKSGTSAGPTPSPSQPATGGGAQTPDPTPSGSSGDGSGSTSGHDSTGGQDNAPDTATQNPAGQRPTG